MYAKQKILIISHGHPEIMKGGGENAAYNYFKELRDRGEFEVVFLAFNILGNPSHLGTPFETRKSDGSEVIMGGGKFDFFLLSQLNARLVWKEFRDFLDSFQPTVVHFHHYFYLGIEMIREVRKYSESIPIIMTLHEYLAICYHNGQMVKTTTYKLCNESSPIECNKCFPDKTTEDFQLRELYIKSFFNLVDIFIAPSKFLLSRYTDWGIPKEKMLYLDYGQPNIRSLPPRQITITEGRTRFAYFGQLNIYKGILVVLEAIEKLPKEVRKTVMLDIHGANLELQHQVFRDRFNELLDKTSDCVRFIGPYQPEEITKLMANVDWVIVSSIWWENAPLVIEEAYIHKRPVICSNIGGMAEKVEHEKSGLHFQVGDAEALANCITRAATEKELWDKLSNGISKRLTIGEVADRTLEIYRKVQKNRSVSEVLT